MLSWMGKKVSKRKREVAADDDDEEELPPLIFPKLPSPHSLYHQSNHIYFNDDITADTAFNLCRELRTVDNKMRLIGVNFDSLPNQPIYLHLTTNGGSIYSAFSIVDCMNSLTCPVYTIVDGFVASAGTIISIAGKKRYIMPNAYMLIHQLSSGFWGKMNEIDDEYDNLKKLMDHVKEHYVTHTKLKSKALDSILKKDKTWDKEEVIKKGLVDEVYKKKVFEEVV